MTALPPPPYSRDTRLLDAMSDGYLALDPHWRVLYVNRVVAAATGHTPEDLIGHPLFEVFPEARPYAEQYLSHLGAGGPPEATEQVVFSADYTRLGIHFQVKVRPCAEGLEVFFQDVTPSWQARRQASQLLHLTEALNAATHLEQVLDIVLRHLQESAHGVLVAFYMPEEDCLQVRSSLNFNADLVRQYQRMPVNASLPLTDAFRSGEEMVLDAAECQRRYPQLKFSPGTQRLVVLPLRSGGRVLGALGLSLKEAGELDLLARSHLIVLAAQCASAIDRAHLFDETQLNVSRYRSLLESTHVIVWEVNADFWTTRPMPSWEAFTGQPFEEHRGNGYLNAVHPDDRLLARQELLKRVQEAQAFRLRLRLRHHSGEYRLVEVHCLPLRDELGTLYGWMGAIRDISEEDRRRQWETSARRLLVRLGQTHDAQEVYQTTLAALLDLSRAVQGVLVGPTELPGMVRLLASQQVPPELLRQFRQFPMLPDTRLGQQVSQGEVFWLHEALRPEDPLDSALWAHWASYLSPEQAAVLGPVLLVPLQHEGDLSAVVALHFSRTDLPPEEILAQIRWLQPQLAQAMQRAQLLRNLHRSEQQAQTILRSLNEGVLLFDEEGEVIACNPTARQITGMGPEHSWPSAFDPAWGATAPDGTLLPVTAYPAVQAITHGETITGFVLRFARPDGIARLLSINAIPTVQDQTFRGAVVSFSDVTESYHLRQQLERQAQEDNLTGLPNRRVFNWSLKRIIESPQTVHAVLLLDIDEFKTVNDTYGHQVGDELLQAVARRLTDICAGHCTVVRLAGDEFGILMPVESQDTAAQMAATLIQEMRAALRAGELEFQITLCVGVCLSGTAHVSAGELYRHADLALQEAKRQGPGSWCLFTEDLEAAHQRRVHLERRLRGVLLNERGQLGTTTSNTLSVQYQPIVDLRSPHATTFEALARWHDPELGQVSPLEFIRVAEESGLIHELGARVLHCALDQGKRWSTAWQRPVSVSVNVSATQLMHADFVQRVATSLHELRAPASSLVLEITEDVVIRDVEVATNRLQALRDLGVRIALDDFGTGFSSLGVLGTLPIDILKIDRMFVRQVHENARRQSLLSAIILLGQQLGITVVAEGVETPLELAVLQKLGCTHVQGFLFARPMTAAHVETLHLDLFSGQSASERPLG